jgi:uncharacterized protein YifN (PemK superfamily)
MPLWFQPKPRSVVYCDFTGFRVPEMTKRRPVIVVRAHKRNRKLVYVVPLSTTPPVPPQAFHYRFACSPVEHDEPKCAWAKCDMVAVVSIERLSIGRRRHESPHHVKPSSLLMISVDELASIRRCIAIALGFGVASYICDGSTLRRDVVVDTK